jgi:hypothetical protein
MARLIDARYKGYVGRDAALPTGAIAASLVPAQGSAAAGVPAHGDGRSASRGIAQGRVFEPGDGTPNRMNDAC